MVNINTANADDLISIVHIGSGRAQLIIERRNEAKFKDLYELSTVRGFGKKRIDDILKEGKLTCE
jgi:DNA uptake protein ComE-like DNA-binding protein